MKTSTEFVKGKHNIGYVDSDFLPRMGDIDFELKTMPTFQKTTKRMTDAAIESELKPGFCELGDILAFIQNASEECKDGYANLFYTPAFVVSVSWHGDEWFVHAWFRGGDSDWNAGSRVFSPATVSSHTQSLNPLKLGNLTLQDKLINSIEKIISEEKGHKQRDVSIWIETESDTKEDQYKFNIRVYRNKQ